MKDFDAARELRQHGRAERFAGRDRTFLLGGETFTYRIFVPFSVIASIASAGGSGWSVMAAIDAGIPELIETGDGYEDALERWERAKKTVEWLDVQAAVFWIVEELSERPTEAPRPSGNGRESTGTSSTDDSSSPRAESEVSPA